MSNGWYLYHQDDKEKRVSNTDTDKYQNEISQQTDDSQREKDQIADKQFNAWNSMKRG